MLGDDASTQMSDELGPLDVLLYRSEANPRTGSAVIGVELLESTPEWGRFCNQFDQASRRVLRLRQKVVVPILPTTPPRWVIDSEFDLSHHVQRTDLGGDGTLRDVFDLAETIGVTPIDLSRPLWRVTLVEGLKGGQSAVILHISHAITDGVGGVEMLSNIYDNEADPPSKPDTPTPAGQELSPLDVTRQGLRKMPANAITQIKEIAATGIDAIGKLVSSPAEQISGAVGIAAAAARKMRSGIERSPLLADRGDATRSDAIDIGFPNLRRAAKAAGGTLNDAYLAGVTGTLRRYHQAMGTDTRVISIGVPVSVRSDIDEAGSNHFTAVNVAAPLSEADPVQCISNISTQMASLREDLGFDVVSLVAPLLSSLPPVVFQSLTGLVDIAAAVQASNVPMYPHDTYLAGAKVLRQYGIGPLPGTALMFLMITRAGNCTVTVRYDTASVTDPELFAQCMQEAFDDVLALGDPPARCVPVTFHDSRGGQ